MARTLLVRGMLVGLLAALLAFTFASFFGEPQVGRAIAFESAQARAAGEPEAPGPVSRGVQRTAGLAVGVAMYGVAVGGLFGLAYAVALGRLGRLRSRALAGVLALAGFVVVELVPFLKYPANPPSVGDPDTIGRRTLLYLAMLLLSVLAAWTAGWLARRLLPRLGGWDAALAGVGAFAVIVAVAMAVLPAVDEVPAAFPAGVLWRFRLASLGTQAVLWAGFGLLFGWLTERAERRVAVTVT